MKSFLILGIRDDTSALSDALTTKYLGYAVDSCQMGNLTVMLPGLIDVSSNFRISPPQI
jgi:acetylcholinesterase